MRLILQIQQNFCYKKIIICNSYSNIRKYSTDCKSYQNNRKH
ncbi:hypothetical protein HMPREF3039_00281 [Akkermansia sp. KLE1798]|nr:hypothetical protein HMPREF3039_00281 [Akkermansia sp. KLE1798]KZA03412.1 hypothetical protein HMPREF1326_02953 [Akkermansia sp. KLE1605]